MTSESELVVGIKRIKSQLSVSLCTIALIHTNWYWNKNKGGGGGIGTGTGIGIEVVGWGVEYERTFWDHYNVIDWGLGRKKGRYSRSKRDTTVQREINECFFCEDFLFLSKQFIQTSVMLNGDLPLIFWITKLNNLIVEKGTLSLSK